MAETSSTPAPAILESKPVRTVDSTFLLCCAALLVFNSHLERYYPRSWMAGDGLLGNTMFFVLSGYGIQSSLTAHVSPFFRYIFRRLLRVYPTLLLTLLTVGIPASVAAARAKPWGAFDFLIYPTPYTYIRLILPLYVVLYFVCRTRSRWVVAWSTILPACAYCVLAAIDAHSIPAGSRLTLGLRPFSMHASFYVAATMAGAWLSIAQTQPKFVATRVALLALLLALYFGAKFEMVALGRHAALYPMLHVLTLGSCVTALLSLGSAAAVDIFPAGVRRIIRRLAVLTLEIYVVHEMLIGWRVFINLPLPLNIAALFIATVLVSECVHYLALQIRTALEKRFDGRVAPPSEPRRA